MGREKFCFTVPIFSFLSLCLGVSVASLACRSAEPTDMRALAPAETLIYLESNDLAETLAALTENSTWNDLAESKPDFSYLKNTQFAVAVTGFETSEKQLNGEQAVLSFKPRFVAVADTHLRESTNLSLVENQIGKFVKENYGADARLDKSEKSGAKWFVWSSDAAAAVPDERKLFAAVSQSLIYLANDETAIEKCLAVKRGESENLTKNEALARAREKSAGENRIAFGYVASEGAPQIANVASVFVAHAMSEDEDARSFTARTLPQISQKALKEIVWSARRTGGRGIEDKYTFKTDAEISAVFKETLAAGAPTEFQNADFLPAEVLSATRYNLQNPQIAWRSVLLTAAGQTDAASANVILQFSGALFEPYAIADAETFLGAIGGGAAGIITAKFDEEGEKSVVIVEVRDAEKVKKSIAAEINFRLPPEKQSNADVWKSADKTFAAAFVENKLILGETESVLNCLRAKETGRNFRQTAVFQRITNTSAIAATVAKDSDAAGKIVELLGVPKEENKTAASFYTTETRFDAGAFERKTVSDFGLIGTILEILSDEK